MITRLGFNNFKSWRGLDMQLARITGIFGSNSSGKTSILQMLLMLKQTAESADRMQVLELGGDLRLGTFRDLIYQHDIKSGLKLSLSWQLPKPLRVTDTAAHASKPSSSSGQLAFETTVMENGSGRMVVQRFDYTLGERRYGMVLKDNKYQVTSEGFELQRIVGRPLAKLPPPVKCYGFPDQVRASYQNAGQLADLELAFEKLFQRVFYLGPLREYPQREYTWAGSQPGDVGRRGERVVDALLASRERGLKVSVGGGQKRETLEQYVARWLRKLGLIDSFEVKELAPGSNLYRVLVKRHPRSAAVLITDVGFGVSQVLPVLALCFYVPEGSTIILEQPEIHLHPSVQAGLADVLIDAMNKRKVQVLVESHSEHLLRRLQLRIAEEKLRPEDAALYFCDLKAEASTLERLKLDMFGYIANWPEDFFGDPLGEALGMTEAAAKRKAHAN
jgi:predicted ATPase